MILNIIEQSCTKFSPTYIYLYMRCAIMKLLYFQLYRILTMDYVAAFVDVCYTAR